MALKLNKDEIRQRDAYVAELRKVADLLEDAVRVFNEELEAARVKMRGAIDDYNETLTAARGFAEDIASRLSDEIDEKSEKWQEGEKGEAAVAFKDEWEGVSLEEIDPDNVLPGDMEDIDLEDADTFEALPIEPE